MTVTKFESQESSSRRIPIPPRKSFFKAITANLKETFFPDDPFRVFKKQSLTRRIILGLQYFAPIFQWAPQYKFDYFKCDLLAGITIASLAVPQGISYANLATLPPVVGLYSSFVPPLIYAVMGSSRDLAIGTVGVVSLLFSNMLGTAVNPVDSPHEYLRLAFTATFFAGIFQASLGLLRLGFIVDLLSHATIVGFMGGVSITVCLQQLKGLLGLSHFTHNTDVISVLNSIISQTHQWRWETAVLGFIFLFYMILTKFYSRKREIFFWISAMAPLTSVIIGSIVVYCTHADKRGIPVIGELKKGLNKPSAKDLAFGSAHLGVAIKTGIISAIIALAEGVAVARTFAMFNNYHIDGNKEMVAFGLMNIVGSCTSCYLTSGIFSRTAVNFHAGSKTAVSNIVMSIAVMLTLLFLIPLFRYTPLVVLASIIVNAMLGLLKYEEVIYMWKVDKFDFVICMSSFLGVVFDSVETGLIVAVTLSIVRIILVASRPKTSVLGNLPNTSSYRSKAHYNKAQLVDGILILHIEGPICFASANYLRERIMRWIEEEEDRIESSGAPCLQHVILDMGAVSTIDTSGISAMREVQRLISRKNLKLVLANPGSEVMKKLHVSETLEAFDNDCIHPTVAEAVQACKFMLQTSHTQSSKVAGQENNV